MDSIEKAVALFNKPASRQGAAHSLNVTLTTGVASEDSADGQVLVDLGTDVQSDDGEQDILIPTTCKVLAGDVVQVQLAGADGTGKSPMVVGVIGGGDRIAAETKAQIEAEKNAISANTDAINAATMYTDLTASLKNNIGSNAVAGVGTYFSIVKHGSLVICSFDVNVKKSSSKGLGLFWGLPKAKHHADGVLAYQDYSSVLPIFIKAGSGIVTINSTIPYNGYVNGQLVYVEDDS